MLNKLYYLMIHILLSLLMHYTGVLVYKPKRKITKLKIISFLILIILLLLINFSFSKSYLVPFYCILSIIYYKINYKNNSYLSLYCTLIIIISISVSKFILILLSRANVLTFNYLYLFLVSFFLIIIFRKQIRNIKYNNSLNKKLVLIIYILIYLYPIYILIKVLNKDSIQNIISYLLLSTTLFLLIIEEQKLEKYKILNKELLKLSQTNENLVTTYRKNQHENKNKLIIIKGLINKNNEELINYVNYLINDNIKIKDKWLNELKYIPMPSTKNFLNYKINILANAKAEIEIFVSEELEKINIKKLNISIVNNLNTIIGVMLDNMIEAITKSSLKQVSINIYISNSSLHFLLANTFMKKPDLNKINTIGYSTKGKNRGIGLSLVNDIIKTNKNLELETKIEEKFFVQHLKVKNIEKYLK